MLPLVTMSPPLLQRLARIAPYFRASRAGFAAAFAAAIVAAATEPLLPALLKRLLDEGFGAQRSFALWVVPVFIVGLPRSGTTLVDRILS